MIGKTVNYLTLLIWILFFFSSKDTVTPLHMMVLGTFLIEFKFFRLEIRAPYLDFFYRQSLNI